MKKLFENLAALTLLTAATAANATPFEDCIRDMNTDVLASDAGTIVKKGDSASAEEKHSLEQRIAVKGGATFLMGYYSAINSLFQRNKLAKKLHLNLNSKTSSLTKQNPVCLTVNRVYLLKLTNPL